MVTTITIPRSRAMPKRSVKGVLCDCRLHCYSHVISFSKQCDYGAQKRVSTWFRRASECHIALPQSMTLTSYHFPPEIRASVIISSQRTRTVHTLILSGWRMTLDKLQAFPNLTHLTCYRCAFNDCIVRNVEQYPDLPAFELSPTSLSAIPVTSLSAIPVTSLSAIPVTSLSAIPVTSLSAIPVTSLSVIAVTSHPVGVTQHLINQQDVSFYPTSSLDITTLASRRQRRL
jgi:hypothetical protein